MPDQHWSDVKLLLQFADIADGSTSFLDQSFPEKTFTVNSTAQISGGKLVLADSNDYIRSPDHAGFELGSSDFTLEAFGVRVDSSNADQYFISKYDSFSPGSNERSWMLRLFPYELYGNSTGRSTAHTNIVTAAWTPTVGSTYDLCAERTGDVFRLYVDGTMVATAALAITMHDNGSNLAIGAGNTKSSGNESGFIGAIDAVRLTVGVARYATDTSYTVPTLPLEWGSGSPPQRRSTQTFNETLLHRNRLRSTQTFTETLYGRSEINTTQNFTEVIVQKARPRSTQTWAEVILQNACLRSTQTWTELLRSTSGVPIPPPLEPEPPVDRSFAFEVRPVNEDAIFVSIGSKDANNAFFLERVNEFSSDPTDEFILLNDNRIGVNLVPQRGTKIAITTIGWGGIANDQKVLETRLFSHLDDDWPTGTTGPFYLRNPAGLVYKAENIYAVLDKQRVGISLQEHGGYYAVYLSEEVGTFGRLQIIVYDTDQFLHVEQTHHTYDGNTLILDPLPSPTVPIESTLLVWRKITDSDVGTTVGDDTIPEEAAGRYVRLTPPKYRFYRGDGDNSIVLRDSVPVGDAWVWIGEEQIGAVNDGPIPIAVMPQTYRGTISSHVALPSSPAVGDYYEINDYDGTFDGQWNAQRQPYWQFSTGDIIVYLGDVWDASHDVKTIFLRDDYSLGEGDFLAVADLSEPFDYIVENGDQLRLPAIGETTTTGQEMADGDIIRVLGFSHNDNLGIQTERFTGTEQAEYILSQRPWDTHTLWVTLNGRDQVYGMDFTITDLDPTYDVAAIEEHGYDLGRSTPILKFFNPHSGADTVVATTLANRPYRQPVAFRLYQNNHHEWQYLRISDHHKAHLRYPFRLNDTYLAVDDARKFIPPAYRDQTNIVDFAEPYAVLVENERFEFTKIDLSGDVHLLLNIRRGTGGTSSGIKSDTISTTVPTQSGQNTYSFDLGEDQPISAAAIELASVDFRGHVVREYRPSEYEVDETSNVVQLTLKSVPNTNLSLRLKATVRDWTNPNPIVYDVGSCVVDVGSQQVIPTGYRWINDSIQYSNAAMPVFLREYPGTQYCPETDIEPAITMVVSPEVATLTLTGLEPTYPVVDEWGPFWLDTSQTDYAMQQYGEVFYPFLDEAIHYSVDPVYVWTSYRTVDYAGPTAYGTTAYSNVDWNNDHYVVPGVLVINGVSIEMPANVAGFEEVPGNYFDVAERINQTTAQHGVRAAAMPLLEKIPSSSSTPYQNGAICTLKLNSTSMIDLTGSDQTVVENLGFGDYATVYEREPHWSIGNENDFCALFQPLDGDGKTSGEVRIFQKLKAHNSGSSFMIAWEMSDVTPEWHLVGSGDFRNVQSYSRFWNWMRQIPNVYETIVADSEADVLGSNTSYGLGGVNDTQSGYGSSSANFPPNASLMEIWQIMNHDQDLIDIRGVNYSAIAFKDYNWTADISGDMMTNEISLIVGNPEGHQIYNTPNATAPAVLGFGSSFDKFHGRAVHWYYDSVTIPNSMYLVENPAERPDDVKGGVWFLLDQPNPFRLKRYNYSDQSWYDWPNVWTRNQMDVLPESGEESYVPDGYTYLFGFYDRGRTTTTDATARFDIRFYDTEEWISGYLSYYVGDVPPWGSVPTILMPAPQTLDLVAQPPDVSAMGEPISVFPSPHSLTLAGQTPSVPTGEPALPHRYWRIFVEFCNADINIGILGIEMYTELFGKNQCVGGTADASSYYDGDATPYTPDRAFGGDLSDHGSSSTQMLWSANSPTDEWISYDFGAGNEKEITQIGMWARHVDSYYVNQSPNTFHIQFSDNNVDWVTAWTETGHTWTRGEFKRFTAPVYSSSHSGSPYGSHDYWRLYLLRSDGGEHTIATLELRDIPDGNNVATGGTAFSDTKYDTNHGPENAFDSDPATLWASSSNVVEEKLGYQFPAPQSVAELLVKARGDTWAGEQTPTIFGTQFSDDGVNWTTAWGISSTAAWSASEERVFTDPHYEAIV